MKEAQRKIKIWTDPVKHCFVLIVFLQLIANINGASDDITNIWYFGCRWFGGSVNMVSCNCTAEAEEMYIQRNSIPGFETSTIEIHNCARVRFGAYSIFDLRNLRTISLNNIQSLIFEPNSLNWVGYRDNNINQEERFDLSIPSLKVAIRNSHVSTIGSYTFVGRINEIKFENSEIDNIDAFAFSNLLQMENLLLTNVVLKDVRPQAFKKFGSEFVVLDGVKADYLPSRTFSNVTIYRSFIVRNCEFHTLRPATFIVNQPAVFTVTNNQIEQLEGEAFLLSTTGDVLIKNNIFTNVHDYAFTGITLNANEVSSSRAITFDSNTFGTMNRHSLDVQPQFQARVSNLSLNETCDCDNIVSNLQDNGLYNDIQCRVSGGLFVTVNEFKARNCSILSGYYTIMIVTCIVILVVGILAIAFYVYYVMVYKRQKYGCEKGRKAPLSLIVPDGRTYKETELHVIVEKADLLTTDL